MVNPALNGQLRGEASYGRFVAKWVLITPQMAADILKGNTRNRKFMEMLSGKYSIDMKDGYWQVTHEGIAICEDGTLIDGQHRLAAIIESGKSVVMLVVTGLPRSSIECINRGKVRTLAHNLQIFGGYEEITGRLVAVARRMYLGALKDTKASASDSLMRRFIDKNIEALVFAKGCISGACGPAPIAAVVARAYYHADTDRLSRFPLAMMDQIAPEDYQPGDRSARQLRRMIDKMDCTGGGMSMLIYRKAQNALKSYLTGVDLAQIREVSDDLFPLPLDRQIETEGNPVAIAS